jgi:hypothetical protein
MVTLIGVTAVLWSPSAGAAIPARSVNLAGAFDQDCVAAQYKPKLEGDCTGDGIGATFIAEKFPSGTLVLSGIPFTLGPMTGTSPNAASGKGQVVQVNAPGGYRWANVLVTAVHQTGGTKSPGNLIATYADGSRTTAPMGTYDWWNKDRASTAAITAPNQNFTSPAGTQFSTPRYVWVESVPINPGPALTSLTLSAEGLNLRIFAITLAANPAHQTKAWTPQ